MAPPTSLGAVAVQHCPVQGQIPDIPDRTTRIREATSTPTCDGDVVDHHISLFFDLERPYPENLLSIHLKAIPFDGQIHIRSRVVDGGRVRRQRNVTRQRYRIATGRRLAVEVRDCGFNSISLLTLVTPPHAANAGSAVVMRLIMKPVSITKSTLNPILSVMTFIPCFMRLILL